MNKKQYVQHISGVGEKWEVSHEYAQRWDVKPNQDEGPAQILSTWLPKSEYVEVPAPDVWTDVTADCELEDDGRGDCQLMHGRMSRFIRSMWGEGYRMRKISFMTGVGRGGYNHGFIIEQMVQP